MKKAPVKKVKVAKSGDFKAYIRVLGQSYVASGASVVEAISNLPVKNAKGKAILSIEVNGVRRDKILTPALTFRLFNSSGLMREVALKQVSFLFS
jgi:hypothetical protein